MNPTNENIKNIRFEFRNVDSIKCKNVDWDFPEKGRFVFLIFRSSLMRIGLPAVSLSHSQCAIVSQGCRGISDTQKRKTRPPV